MKDFPKISIVTPSLNQGRYLEKTIQSVLSQNYPNLEYIIIDGGSTDGSIEIIKKYEDQLAYWISEPDRNMYEAIQKGFDKSTGEIMAWINSDDMYFPGAFEIVAELLNSFKEISWLQGIPAHFDEKGRCVTVFPLRKWSKYDYYTGNYKWIQQEATFWRRDLWNKAEGMISRASKIAGDLELWLHFFRFDKLYVTSALLGGFRIRSSEQLSLDYGKLYEDEAERLIKSEPLAKNEMAKVREIKHLICLNKYFVAMRLFIASRFIIRRIEKLKDYSPVIEFNRFTQSFTI
jgi:glycosyltransferase involved in cell wall biosynthesis